MSTKISQTVTDFLPATIILLDCNLDKFLEKNKAVHLKTKDCIWKLCCGLEYPFIFLKCHMQALKLYAFKVDNILCQSVCTNDSVRDTDLCGVPNYFYGQQRKLYTCYSYKQMKERSVYFNRESHDCWRKQSFSITLSLIS